MTPQELEVMQMALDALEKNKRTHYYCEDTWYSCPKHEDGCANDAEGDECNCGADRINTVLDKTIKALRARLEQPEQAPTNNGRYLTGYKAQPEQEPVATLFGSLLVYDVPTKQEPVAWMHNFIDEVVIAHRPVDLDRHPDRWTELYKDPTPCKTCEALARTVMMDQTSHDTAPSQREWVGLTDEDLSVCDEDGVILARYWEAKLKEKNT